MSTPDLQTADPRPAVNLTTPEGSRRTVATFRTYDEAVSAVDRLSDARFPVEHATIVGRGLHMVEEVSGRFSWPQALLRGALTGALTGALIGWLFVVFDWFDPIVARVWLIVDATLFGAAVGALFGLLMYAMSGGRRDFSSVPMLRADQYDLLVDDAFADQAQALLSGAPTTTNPDARGA